MGNRMIKESIRTDKQINELNDFCFRLWTYLLTYVDDYGRGNADPDLLKGFCFARRKDVTTKHIEKGLEELQNIDLIRLYKVEDEIYLYFPSWEKHQRIQTKKSKCPEPVDAEKNFHTVVHGGIELSTVSNGNPPPETNRNQVEIEKETNSKPIINNYKRGAKNIKVVEVEENKAVFELCTNTGELYPFYQDDIDSYKSLYPAVDVEQEMRKMIGWLDANPTKRKTKSGMKRFVNAWLARQQDSAKTTTAPAARSKFNNFEQRSDEIDTEMNDKFLRELKVIKGG